jgi:hypothetical protein
MAKQLHKRFLEEQVRALLKRYLCKEIELRYIIETVGIRRSRFFVETLANV